MAEFTIEIRSHHFVIRNCSPRGRQVVEAFGRKYVQYGYDRINGRNVYVAKKVFAASTKDRSEFRFHINQLKAFQRKMEHDGLPPDAAQYIQAPIFEPVKVELPLKPHWVDLPHQPPVIEYLIDPGDPLLKLVSLQTGKGKSYCSMKACSIIGHRVLIFIRPMFIEKWVEDIMRTFDIELADILVVEGGSKHLLQLLALADAGLLTQKIIIVSNKLWQNWLKLYEQFKEETMDLGYLCMPDEFCQFIGAGTRLIDEVHLDFHLNFKTDLYTHTHRSMSLSATLIADDDFVNQMYELAYPSPTRYQGPAYDRYINARALFWRLQFPNKVRTKDYGQKSYSHHVFEKSILRSTQMLNNYLRMIKWTVEQAYANHPNYKRGDRLIVFCAGIELCTVVTDYLRKVFPQFSVERYVEMDQYENLMEPDIRVSTVQSAGTAVDIPQLFAAILTHAISSSQSNIQGFGRLRTLKDGRNPEFWYFACEDISKHMEYHERKRVLLEERALHYRSITYPGGPV